MSEKQEFYKLINDKTKVPRLLPIPQMNNLQAERTDKNPLQKFRTQAMKFVKPKPPQPKLKDKWKNSVNRISRTFQTEELIRRAKAIDVPGLLPEWETNIFKLISKNSKRKHVVFLMSIMKEVRQDYLVEMQNFNAQNIVKTADGADNKFEFPEDHLHGLAMKDSPFLAKLQNDVREIRRVFPKKYLLSHRLVRNIASLLFNNLPESFIDFDRYSSLKELHVSKLSELMNNDLSRSSLAVQNQCYNEIVRSMLRISNLKTHENLPKLLHCAESFMVQRILNSMMNTIDMFIGTIREGSDAQLMLQLHCRNDGLELEPSIEEIFATYHRIVDNVTSIGQDLVPLGDWMKVNDSASYIKVNLPEWFLQQAHGNLQRVLDDNYKPLREHYDSVCARFNVLCSDATKKQIARLTSGRKDFEAYFAEVDRFKGYLAEVTEMQDNIYHKFGLLNQSPAIDDLKRNASAIITILIDELIGDHQDLNRSICREFENLESHALAIPDDTKALFELTEYVSHASKFLITELEDKIRKSIHVLSRLLQVALLSDEHIELNRATINWLEMIKPVFSQHNIFCEAKKGELEDELQRKVNALNIEIEAIFPELVIISDMDDTTRTVEYKEFLATILNTIKQLDNQIEQINNEEKLFKFPETTFPKIDEIKEVMSSFCSLIQIIFLWQKDYGVWMNGPFEYLDAQIIESKTTDYFEKITEMHKSFKIKIKSDLTSHRPFKFTGIVDDPDPMQQPAPLKLCWQTLQNINDFRRYVPLAICICNPALEKRHWDEMSSIAGINLLPNAGTTLKKIIDLNLLKDFESYEAISIGANKELVLHQKLNAMIQEWSAMNFTVSTTETSGSPVFVDENKIEILLEHQFIEITRMRASYFITPIESKVIDFHEKLCCIRSTIEYWNNIQLQCKYLNSFLSNEIVQSHLGTEFDLYVSLMDVLDTIKETLSSTPTFNNITKNNNIVEKLKQGKYALELINLKVHNYFDQLRMLFPRLFFISDNEIMKLLFEYPNHNQNDSHIRKCFPNIMHLKLSKEFNILGIIGANGEELKLEKVVPIVHGMESVTDWLKNLEKEIKCKIKNEIHEVYTTFDDEFTLKWISNNSAMVIFCVWQIIWTTDIHSCIARSDFDELKANRANIKEHKETVQKFLKLNLSRKDREIITSLIILLIHEEEILNMLIEKKVHEDTDFDWKAQMRYYYQEKQVKVIIINTCIDYAYEYYSNSQRIIVNTPLTERCYRNLMEAYYQNHFGTIVGFSSVGKTETVRNLARALAVPFFMFLGDDSKDYDFISNIFKGLVATGSWIYYKNFTQMKEGILSVIAQYIFRISRSKSLNLESIIIDGTQLVFNRGCYFCCSVNPATPNLSSIPENLKLHFRTVCFMSPDTEKVFEVELFASGFLNAKRLATLLMEVFNLCKNQMSSTESYNLRLRNLKTVISTAAKLKFSYPDEEEQVLLFRSLIDSNVSQFFGNDIIMLTSIFETTFSGAELPPSEHDNLLEAVEKICVSQQLSNHDALKLKIIQLYEIIHLKQAIIIVGSSFSGKSTLLRILLESILLMQSQDNQNRDVTISCEIINPGALCSDRMYGFIDKDVEKWNDGVCTEMIRRFTENDTCKWKWLILDGHMHSSWVEKLETALDDNHTLFLNSNEQIILDQETRIFFETMNLQNVTPSTISRCGIVHVESEPSDWKQFLLADIINVDQYRGYQKFIFTLFSWIVGPCLEFIHENCVTVLDLSDMHLVMSTLDLFKMYMNHAIDDRVDKKEKDTKDHFMMWCQASVIMATVWGLAGTLDFESKQRFQEFFVSFWRKPCESRPKEIKQFEIVLPADGKLQDHFYIFKGPGSWKNYGEIVKTEKIREDDIFSEPFVPTIDSVRLSTIFDLHIKNRKPFILCGEKSTGKTSILQEYFSNLPRSEYIFNNFNFKSIPKSDVAQRLFLSKLNKIKRFDYKPSKNRCCINLIVDLNAASDGLMTNSALELIRQYMDYRFWYDLEHVAKVILSNILFAASITAGREKSRSICPRFLRHFNVLTLHTQSRDNMFRIFSNTLMLDWKKNSFTADVSSCISSIVNATLDVYLSTVQKLKPTPTKTLYRFSLFDIYKIMSGCGLIQKESVETKITFIRLWAHETFRVLSDRIVNIDDQQWLFSRVRESIKTNFKDPFESVFDYLPKYENGELTRESFRDLVFGNFMDTDRSKRKYEEINSMENLKNKFQQYIKEHNDVNEKKLDLVVTCHAIEHLVRICRVLAIPGGNLLMISSSGSGRKSLTKLAAFIQQQSLFEPMIDTHYDEFSWRKDLKSIMIECGTLKRNYTFLITDRQMRTGFIQDINSLLSFGGIPELFSDDERREIIKAVRVDAQRGLRNLEINMSRVYDYFLHQCKQKLHFVINLGPSNENLKYYLNRYPKVIDKCTINWLDNWPAKALEQIAIVHMKTVNIPDPIKFQVVSVSKELYERTKEFSARYYEESGKIFHIAPGTFIRTLKIYVDIMSKKREEIESTRKRYMTGLDKLQLAAGEVVQIQNTLTKLRPQLEASARQTEATMKEIESENVSVERATVLVKRDEEKANKKAEIAGILKAECEAELAVAIPILEYALEALNTLKPTDITLVKAMKNPPDTVKLVMAAVCVMLNVASERVVDPVTGRKTMDYWGPSKRVLGDMNFLQNLKDYDKDSISPAIMTTIKKTYMTDRTFQPHIVAKASSAAEGLCKWVRAMVSYDDVAKVVAPKKEKLAAAQKECDEVEAFLNAKRKTLADLNMKLAALKSTLEATLAKKLQLEKDVEMCTMKLKKAEGLIASLGGEKTRWMESADKLSRLRDNLVGDVLLSSAIITYVPSFSLAYREKNICEWKELVRAQNIPFSEEYNFVDFLGKEIRINNWRLCGLSNNQFSLQNAIIMENSPMWCLFIDPQNQANEWIKSMEKPNDLQVVKVSNPSYMEIIRRGMEMGNPVLLENIEEDLDVSLDSFLTGEAPGVSEVWSMSPGIDSVVYKSSFRFYLTTKQYNPRYSPDVFNKVTVTDFMLPSDALRDRLLDIVIFREKPELQEKFEKILVENINNKKILKQQEDNILHTLSASDKNILEDEAAIKSLDASKSLAIDFIKRQEATRVAKEDIEAFRETYNQLTKYCADLYSTLNILPKLNHMYRFSLSWFTQLYIKSIESSNPSTVHRKRIDFLKNSSIQNLQKSVHNALFEKHKLIYSFILCAKTLMDTESKTTMEQVTEQEFNIFMSIGGKRLSKSDREIGTNPASSWLSDESWEEICHISSSLTVFQNFPNSFSTNITKWSKFCNSMNISNSPMPTPWDYKLSAFQKLILIRVLCPDRIISKITEFVESILKDGKNTSTLSLLNSCQINRPYAESNCLTPLLFILPSYSSPFAVVNRFAKILKYSEKLHVLSMGPSQEQKAELLIERARRKGEWIFLHNCHLALKWMIKLETILESFNMSNTSPDFRLWMSAQAHDEFPIGILQDSIKIALDAPYELKQTLIWTYRSEPMKDKEFYEGCPGKDKAFSKLLYGFCLFHAVIRERRNFGMQSWNFQYDFDESDIQMSIIQLKNWINQCEKVPFKALTYFLGECNYGGKIIDNQDKVYLDTLALEYCNSKVINESCQYDFDTVPVYRVPKRSEYKEFLKHIINSIPNQTSVEDFCFDKNIALIRNRNKVRDFWDTLTNLSESSVINDAEDKSIRLSQEIDKLLGLLPKYFNIAEVENKYAVKEAEPLNIVLVEEIKSFNGFLSAVRSSLEGLKTANDGDSLCTETIQELSEEILQGIVPKSWKVHISLQSKDTSLKFVTDLSERHKYLNDWIDRGHPRFHWFGGLASCKRLLSTMRMIFAREKQVPIDQIAFEFSVLELKSPTEDFDVPENSLCVYGLTLVGARWNEETKSLSSTEPNIFYNDMPVVLFRLVIRKNTSSINSYKCPLYVSPNLRNSQYDPENLLDNHIVSVNLRSDVNPKIWVKCGTALYCQTV